MAADDAIRAADADRENVVAILRDSYAAGRLTLAEFDERTSAAFAARTWGELRSLTEDLPDRPRFGRDLPALPAPPAGTAGGVDRGRRAPRAGQGSPGTARLIPALPIVFVWLAIALFAHNAGAFVPIAVLLLIGLKSAVGHDHGQGRGPGRPL